MANELAKAPATPLGTLQAYFEARKNSLAAVLPKHMTAERVLRIVFAAASRTPKLLECTPESIYLSCHSAGQLGLEPGGPLGHAYLVPYFNSKIGRMECQYQPGYKGLVDLARRSGLLSTIAARLVHENDKLDYHEDEKGLHFDFRPATSDRGPVIGAFAYAVFKDGGCQFEHMTIEEMNAIRARSKAKDSGPWVTDTGEMYRKTVIKRLSKLLPMSVEMADAIEHDDLVSVNGHSGPEMDLQPVSVSVEKTSRTDQLKAKLGAPAAQDETQAEAPKTEPAAEHTEAPKTEVKAEQPKAAPKNSSEPPKSEAKTTAAPKKTAPTPPPAKQREPGEDDELTV